METFSVFHTHKQHTKVPLGGKEDRYKQESSYMAIPFSMQVCIVTGVEE